jgi:hypothetical protein
MGHEERGLSAQQIEQGLSYGQGGDAENGQRRRSESAKRGAGRARRGMHRVVNALGVVHEHLLDRVWIRETWKRAPD